MKLELTLPRPIKSDGVLRIYLFIYSLPHSIKLIMDTSRFKQLLKSHLFRIAF